MRERRARGSAQNEYLESQYCKYEYLLPCESFAHQFSPVRRPRRDRGACQAPATGAHAAAETAPDLSPSTADREARAVDAIIQPQHADARVTKTAHASFRAASDEDGNPSRETPLSMVEWSKYVTSCAASSRSTRATTL